jgi:hypothetical protein
MSRRLNADEPIIVIRLAIDAAFVWDVGCFHV